ncbi:MAG: multiheme c-type cytochrome [Methylicorpusculum sp.]|uniref:cytochrome c3 family protein n=1 Tax=Methylicorpusculum sp. TaxID=2713644 RepID=UPI00272068E5|nr:cytochrome c3 family protein [Methylicorpusculum sp.]MDO8938156.1 multiheme c-type cytochrome [Methylicorpusculum sp.]MDP2204048.1 multiheme c-type cytochrome [Methylicorpusculum sp.]
MTVSFSRKYLGLAVSALLMTAVGLTWLYYDSIRKPASVSLKPSASNESSVAEYAFVGRAVCADCHAEQDGLWQGSHHDLAMQEVGEQTVLGDFQDAEFSKDGVVSGFFRQNGRFMVRTDGPDGKLADFEIKYTFGVTPLQQYLIELPGGKLQALSIVWDSRTKEQGGQRWFHLYPDEKIDHQDELHWTRRSQNWNFMCAECHSTNLQKNYDAASRTYHTTWSEIDVSCEACHGPGSRHVSWANKAPDLEYGDNQMKGLQVLLNDRHGAVWSIDPRSGNARRNTPRGSDKEIEICARCHSRRAQLFDDYRHGPLLDTHLPSLLRQTLYHADGQIDGEVYEYGSFLQSKMYQAGVTCSDCHEPHSLTLRAAGNGVCRQCHAADKYDDAKHHFHAKDSAGGYCVDCHMPAKTYMGVDARRDHGFRIPRPDLSEKIGIPNACNACHADKPAQWAADTVRKWYGHDPKGYQDYAEALHAARIGSVEAKEKLLALLEEKDQPAIARATAISELASWLSSELLPVFKQALQDSEPLLRSAALEALEQLPPDQRWPLAHDRLRDPVRSVRALAVAALAGIDRKSLSSAEQAEYEQASNDYFDSLALNADDPAAQVNRGNFHTARNEFALAESAYQEALTLDPDFVMAYINLADLFRLTHRDSEGRALLERGLARLPGSADLHHSLGLLHARQKNTARALDSLQRAVELAPEQARFSYVYAVALIGSGHAQEAQVVVLNALKLTPSDSALNALNIQFTTEE